MRFKNIKEAREALRAKYSEMKECDDPVKFDELSKEFDEINAEKGRIETMERAEKEFVAAQPAIEPHDDKSCEPVGYEKAVKDLAAAARKNFNEGTPANGGYTVPEDIRTKIEKLRDAKFSLRELVSVENVKTNSGQRTYQNRASGAGFASVAEGGKIPKMGSPTFFRVKYEIEKFAGFMFATNELLADTDANIVGIVTEWFAENARVTDNKIVIATLNEKYTRTTNPATAATISGLDDIKSILNVTLGQTFAPTSKIVTNDDGLQFLDTLKDKEDHSYLKVDENKPLQRYLAVGFRKVPLEVVPNGDLPTDATKGVPFYIGDLKEACRIYDRKALSLMASNVASIGSGNDAVNAFGEDLTVWRGIERLDCELIDETAYVLGYYKASSGTGGSGGTQNAG